MSTSTNDTTAAAAAAAVASASQQLQPLPSLQPIVNAAALCQIAVYACILLLSCLGNALVIVTLVRHRRMRTVTNVFLLNLAVADLLLGVLCMPVTLLGALLRDFVLGGAMCKLIPYFQGECASCVYARWMCYAAYAA